MGAQLSLLLLPSLLEKSIHYFHLWAFVAATGSQGSAEGKALRQWCESQLKKMGKNDGCTICSPLPPFIATFFFLLY